MIKHLQCCPLCGSKETSPFLAGSIDTSRLNNLSYASRKEPEFMNFPYVECKICDLIYTPTPPENTALKQAYQTAEFDSATEANFAAKTYRKIFSPWINLLSEKTCAVDIGAGNGALLPLLIEEGFNTTIGIEPSPAAIFSAQPEVRVMLREGIFSREIIGDLTPDFICTSMTMEHVIDPLELVKIAQDKLASNGIIAVVVHNRRAVLNRLLGKRSPIIDIEHLQLFSPKSLELLFLKANLKPLFIGSFCNTYPLRYWIRLLPMRTEIKQRIIKMLEKLRLSQIAISLPVGNLLGIAQKQ